MEASPPISFRMRSTAVRPDVVRHARERLADVKGLAVAVELAMVVVGEGRVGAQLSSEETARQRCPGVSGQRRSAIPIG
jgi:hypothetical protein